jgi:hypothetical protein
MEDGIWRHGSLLVARESRFTYKLRWWGSPSSFSLFKFNLKDYVTGVSLGILLPFLIMVFT